MEDKRLALKRWMSWGPRAAGDVVSNWRYARAEQRFLIVHNAAKRAIAHQDFLTWVTRELPEVRARFEFHLLPCRRLDWSRYLLHVSWAGDTLGQWSPQGFQQLLQILHTCDERGIPAINRADVLSNTIKSVGARLMAAAGIRTPGIVPIDDFSRFRRDLGGLQLPLLIREDRGHGQRAVLVRRYDQLRQVPMEKFRHPIAVEFIDTRDPRDGMYRKYRYVMAGNRGVPRHLIVSDEWEVRAHNRIKKEAFRREELDYVHHADPHHRLFQKARLALGLDIVGFDYGYDQEGHLVVWEANPYPDVNYPKNPWVNHLNLTVEKNFAAIVCLYLERAGLPVPEKVSALLEDLTEAPVMCIPLSECCAT